MARLWKMNKELFNQLAARVAGIKHLKVNSHLKITVFGVSLGVALIGLLTLLLRKKEKKKRPSDRKSTQTKLSRSRAAVSGTNGDVAWSKNCSSPTSSRSFIRNKALSVSNSNSSLASSTSTLTHSVVETTEFTAAQLCQLGLENLDMAISHWEDALAKLSFLDAEDSLDQLAIPDTETSVLQHQLENLLELALRMQDGFERSCERQADQAALESALAAFAEIDRIRSEKQYSTDLESSEDQESFVSATDMADLTDVDTYRDLFKRLPLYEAALQEHKYNGIAYRTIRTHMVGCLKDAEFLAKLHCLREGFNIVFKDVETRRWLQEMGCNIIAGLLQKADRDTEEFYQAYQDMMDYINDDSHRLQMEEELREKGVKKCTFYDVFLDFILLDAFDDLENPPKSVVAVVQNQWLSNGFKETALSTAVWSVLKAKRRMLKFPHGFISYFYSISELITPVLVWGLLGPQSNLKTICCAFKDIVYNFIKDIFSFEKVRFTTQEDMGSDLLRIVKEYVSIAENKLCSANV
ncbi:mitoguardin isoform X1 [Octopus sinensis]|uniref:Mitoguardin isoform X1 n=1 Tax=Octopus sinensis TaxID=2607531 RepID=A0A7E6F592_9MOLL|nr:mitoguardin isoform X1 [Octopus sinensis]